MKTSVFFVLVILFLKIILSFFNIRGMEAIYFFILFIVSWSLLKHYFRPFPILLLNFDLWVYNNYWFQSLLSLSFQVESFFSSLYDGDLAHTFFGSLLNFSFFHLFFKGFYCFVEFSYCSFFSLDEIFHLLFFLWVSFYFRLRWNIFNCIDLQLDTPNVRWAHLLSRLSDVCGIEIKNRLMRDPHLNLISVPLSSYTALKTAVLTSYRMMGSKSKVLSQAVSQTKKAAQDATAAAKAAQDVVAEAAAVSGKESSTTMFKIVATFIGGIFGFHGIKEQTRNNLEVERLKIESQEKIKMAQIKSNETVELKKAESSITTELLKSDRKYSNAEVSQAKSQAGHILHGKPVESISTGEGHMATKPYDFKTGSFIKDHAGGINKGSWSSWLEWLFPFFSRKKIHPQPPKPQDLDVSSPNVTREKSYSGFRKVDPHHPPDVAPGKNRPSGEDVGEVSFNNSDFPSVVNLVKVSSKAVIDSFKDSI